MIIILGKASWPFCQPSACRQSSGIYVQRAMEKTVWQDWENGTVLPLSLSTLLSGYSHNCLGYSTSTFLQSISLIKDPVGNWDIPQASWSYHSYWKITWPLLRNSRPAWYRHSSFVKYSPSSSTTKGLPQRRQVLREAVKREKHPRLNTNMTVSVTNENIFLCNII